MIDIRAIVGISALIVVAGFVSATFYYRGEARKLAVEVATVEQKLADARLVNTENLATIDKITRQNLANDLLIRQITVNIQAINETQAETAAAITELAKNDEPSRDYLNQSLPDGVKRLLNK